MYPESRIRVFVVEDFKLLRLNLKSILSETRKINLVGAFECAEIAIGLIPILKPDVILMDLGLPGMSGIEATLKIKRSYPDIKIIILSAHEEAMEILAALHSGADGYYLSNYNLDMLPLAIETVFQGSIWLDPLVNKGILNLLPKLPPLIPDASKFSLTTRELEVLNLIVQGKTNLEIADALIVSVHTAKAHVCKILHKLQVKDRIQAATKAIRENLV